MRKGFYFKLAISNIKRNKDVFKPYMFASALMVFVYYVFKLLNGNEGIAGITNSMTFSFVMMIGVYVAMGFSVIFIFYANSFIMKRRKKELGLYGILGLEKRHIGILMAWETVITGVISMASGIIFGLVFSKLAVLAAAKLMRSQAESTLIIKGDTITGTILFFAAVFLLVLIYNLFQVSLSRPIDLLKSENKGEAEPKGSLALTVAGVLFLAAGYGAAWIMSDAGLIFVLAGPTVAAVIIGTYMLFVAGSIFVLKQMKKSRRIYYKPDNFISISGLMHRMKQNAVGLASICILCTMVIITLSTTFCLWFGVEDSLKNSFSDDVTVSSMPEEYKTAFEASVKEYSKKYDVSVDDLYIFEDRGFQGNIDSDGNLTTAWKKSEDGRGYSLENYLDIIIISAQDYEMMTGQTAELAKDEAFFVFDREKVNEEWRYTPTDGLNHISAGMTLHVDDDGAMALDYGGQDAEEIKPIDVMLKITDVRSDDTLLQGKYGQRGMIYLVVADEDMAESCSNRRMMYSSARYRAVLNYSGSETARSQFIHAVDDALYATGYAAMMYSFDLTKERYYGAYGGLLFVGVFLSILFLMAMVIIIYYKQMSEGFEDKARYHILMQVGIDEQDVRKTINKQVRSIFMLPLLVGVIHTAAAFKMMGHLVSMADVAGIENYGMFGLCTIIVTGLTALIYMVVYKITAKAYYKFVY